jgi:hypothetical protein
MANRHTLSVTKIDCFKDYLEFDGWNIQEPKGYYEVLRATKDGRKHPLIVYFRHNNSRGGNLSHYTVADRDMGVVRAFLKKKYESEGADDE